MTSGDRTRTASRLAALAFTVTLVAGACAPDDDTVGESMHETVNETAEAAAQQTTTTEATTAAETTGGAATDGDAADGTADADAEPRFDLDGELPLTAAEVNDMLAFIEGQTGREFLYKPRIVAQTRTDYEAALELHIGDQITDFASEAESAARLYQALGLSDQSPQELTESVTAVMTSADGISGYYDPDTDALYVPTDALDDGMFRGLLVHELAHALDGQHVDLGRIIDDMAASPEDAELNFGRTAVVEGRATAIQFAWMQENGVLATAADLPASLEAVPPAFLNALTLPYNFGAGWVLANGGPAETWDAFESPPTTSEMVLFPDTPATEAVVEVATPTADGPVIDTAQWGASSLLVWLLSEDLEPAQAEVMAGLAAADGWAGGAMVLWGDDAESCVRIVMATDGPNDLAEMEAILTDWAGEAEGRTVTTAGDEVTVTGCAPFQP
ncbi:MAG: hypothetical protein AAF962_09295 [Actinomycetota bacterium]